MTHESLVICVKLLVLIPVFASLLALRFYYEYKPKGKITKSTIKSLKGGNRG